MVLVNGQFLSVPFHWTSKQRLILYIEVISKSLIARCYRTFCRQILVWFEVLSESSPYQQQLFLWFVNSSAPSCSIDFAQVKLVEFDYCQIYKVLAIKVLEDSQILSFQQNLLLTEVTQTLVDFLVIEECFPFRVLSTLEQFDDNFSILQLVFIEVRIIIHTVVPNTILGQCVEVFVQF